MKRFIFVVFLLAFLSACTLPWQRGDSGVDSMTVGVGGEYYFKIVPDYDARLLNVNFNGKDEGTIGGEFFDEFENLVYLIEKDYKNGRGVIHGTDDEKINFELSYLDGRENVFIDYKWGEETDYMDDIVSFYTGIAELFNEDTY